MKTIPALLMAFLIAPLVAGAVEKIKPAYVAGQFYDKDPARLAAQIELFLSNARLAAPVSGKIRALIVPHAGHVYSGQTAAYAYALVQGSPYETVVIIGPSHHFGFHGCSIYPGEGFATPLGTARIDSALAQAISKAGGFTFVPEAYFVPGAEVQEHSVEVQVPFIQKVLPDAKIVPIVMGYQTKPTIQALASALEKACAGKNVLVVASTDLSHFLSKSEAATTDAGTISLIRSAKTDTLIRKIEAGDNIMCGGGPVVAALLYAQKAGPVRVDILKHSDSSDSGGPQDRVVGYLAAALVSGPENSPAEFTLTAEDKAQLLGLARSAVTEFVSRRAVIDDRTGNPKFLAPRGVFVTLKKRGELRGCIGYIEPVAPLAQAVIETAIYAATRDPRFPPVNAEEAKDLGYEISVLTPLKEITDPDLVQVGRHGIVISRGGQKGVLLPQVPVENGWDRNTFLEEGCLKAGLPADAWKKGAKISVFEAIVFHE
ncbi:MAG: AmmeMemoRadiSam system protein B [Candidatus Aminicenantales bacterium]|jgi:AmmeMemoRadiSam system protein B/AmmeMemoRadiSam system protein A